MLAHSGHWLTNVIYIAPIVGVALFIGIQNLRAKRKGIDLEEPEPTLDEIMDGKR